MRRQTRLSAHFAALLLLFSPFGVDAQVKTPREFFGFEPGSDRTLFDYGQLIEYLKSLDKSSPRLEMRQIGTSPQGRPMFVSFLSAEQNISQLDALAEINKRLALDADIPADQRTRLVQQGRVFVLITLSMHSSEVGPSQSLPIIAHRLVTTQDREILEHLSNVVLMIVPCHNPDGMDMIVKHYRKHMGTPYEGSSMPGLYHKYVGHDNNRDFVALTQEDTRAIARIYSTAWYPQVMVEKHQMGKTGPRYFVPPNHDPIAENVDHGLWHWSTLFGSNLARDMGQRGLKGVASHWVFDEYWPGSTETSLWKNVISFLTEAASCKIATPVFVEPTELKVFGKGLAEYKKSINMPLPWPGGWWRLSDIVLYELVTMESILKTASSYAKDILRFRNDICRQEVQRGKSQPPYYYVLPRTQHDPSELVGLVNLLRLHGVRVFQLNAPVHVTEHRFRAGDVVVPLAQPYRAFVKEVMERQKYPVRHYMPDGEIIRPYDITSWSLPLHRGVTSFQIEVRSEALESKLVEVKDRFTLKPPRRLPKELWALAFPAEQNASFKSALFALKHALKVFRLNRALTVGERTLSPGSFLVLSHPRKLSIVESIYNDMNADGIVIPKRVPMDARVIGLPRIALVETYLHHMDAGWTRFLFDSYHIPFTVLRPGDFGKTTLEKRFDVVVFPDASKDVLIQGRRKVEDDDDSYHPLDFPPAYLKGMGEQGVAKLLRFVNSGGVVVSWGRSVQLFTGDLKTEPEKKQAPTVQLPIRDLTKKAKKNGLFVPGSFLQARFVPGHPLTLGMPKNGGVFSRGEPVFSTTIALVDMDRRVLATYPEEDILLSGYIEGEKQLANKPAMAWVKKGRGQLIVFAFYPQFRGSTPANYKLLFNALLVPR